MLTSFSSPGLGLLTLPMSGGVWKSEEVVKMGICICCGCQVLGPDNVEHCDACFRKRVLTREVERNGNN